MLDAFLRQGHDVVFNDRQNGIDELGVTDLLIYHRGLALFGDLCPLSLAAAKGKGGQPSTRRLPNNRSALLPLVMLALLVWVLVDMG